ncbi:PLASMODESMATA CALLOSE-BINDING PROTEIN 5-like [Impatiens glandulifera]|uniref:PLASMODESMATA CALLOSE-BINDING PROTEIN 5-like n=1 Tax=Impatiens glandulifera TaxID=253017 RepID=UPI001FB08482|nr:PLASMODESMATA CALLOSE-BINDING PROTEIN 5-like [Impatiens glandulifera]
MDSKCFVFLIFIFISLSNAAVSDHYHLRQSTGGGGASVAVELWCVAKNNAETTPLQTALDWACGQGGANCGPIQLGGPCYDPADITRTASYAFNDYFLKHGLTEDSCNFDNTAALTSLNPSHGSCKIPSSSTVKNGSSAAGTTTMTMGDLNSGSSNDDLDVRAHLYRVFLMFTVYILGFIFMY